MRYRNIVFLPALLLAWSVAAQTRAPATADANDGLHAAPAAASSVEYRDSVVVPKAPVAGHFKFKPQRRDNPLDKPPPSAMDKAAVMGTQRPWQNGQPPVDCAMSPRDAACRH